MSGKGLSRFANRSKAAPVAAADNNSTNVADPAAAATPGGESATAPAAAASDGYGMMTSGEEYGGYDEAAAFGYGGGMEDYNYNSPFFQTEDSTTYPEVESTAQETPADRTAAAAPKTSEERDENVAASSNQKIQASEAEGTFKPTESATPPCQVHDSVAKSAASLARPTVSRSWLLKNTNATNHQWLSPTPNGGTTPKSIPPPTGPGKASAPASKPSVVLPRRSGILFTPRPKNQPVLQLVAAPPTPHMTSAAPAAASDDRGSTGGWEASIPQVQARGDSQRGVAGTAPTHGEHGAAPPLPVSILKTPRFQGRESASPAEEEGKLVFTPPPPQPPTAKPFETGTGRARFYETPAPHGQRQVAPAGPPAFAAAVTPGTGSAGKKTVSFDPVNLTETFLIPRAQAGPGQGPGAAAATSPPMQGRESGHVVPMDVEGEVGKVPPKDAFDFDATDDTFMMNCRESIDRVKVMNDEILDLNVYLSSMQADMHVLQANMVDVANDTEALCRGYEDILDLLAKEFPEED